MESAREEVEVVGEVEGEKVQVLAPAVGGREGEKKAEVLQIDLRGFNFCFGFRHFSFGEKIFGMPGQVGRKDDDNEDALREY